MARSTTSLRGMLLEEVLMALLRHSGYVPVEDPASDPISLDGLPGFLKVRGRGGLHQIDVVADFRVHIPFTNPLRLLLECKCFSPTHRAGIEIVRNAVGVLKDVDEFWSVDDQRQARRNRYHYQFVICASSGYTVPAQEYAYAQDVHLLQVPRGSPLDAICAAIRRVSPEHVRRARADEDGEEGDVVRPDPEDGGWLRGLRVVVRRWFREGAPYEGELDAVTSAPDLFREIIDLTRNLGECYLTFLAGRFPVLLVPSNPISKEELSGLGPVRLYFDTQDNTVWWIKRPSSRQMFVHRGVRREDADVLFTFSMPTVLLDLFRRDGNLEPAVALTMKRELFNTLQLLRVVEGVPMWFQLRLDLDWIGGLEEQIADLAARERERDRRRNREQ